MKTEIAVFTTEFLRDFVHKVMHEMQQDIAYSIYPYSDFDDIQNVYKSLPERVRGVVTSGMFPASIIQKSFPETNRIVRAFNNDDGGIYRLFLQLMEENRQLNLNRIFADIIEITGMEIRDFLFGDRTLSCEEIHEIKLKDMSLEEMIAAEKKYMNLHLELWRQGKIDLSVTRFSSIALKLKEEGLKVYFPYPSFSYVKAICMQTVQDVHIAELKSNQPASIIVSGQVDAGKENKEEMVELRRVLQRFNTVHQLGAVLHPIPGGYEVSARRSVIEEITEQFTTCKLREFIEGYGIHGSSVGYGIGIDFYQARINAVDANREARQMTGGASAVINSEDELICPLRKVKTMIVRRIVSDQVGRIAQTSGLSTLTVQKVMSAVEMVPGGRISARELARLLSVTPRSANRYLSALYRAGFAKIVDQRKDHTMGRPEQIYSLMVENAVDW